MSDEQVAVERALAAWRALPDDERNGERPWIMGFNAGWEEALSTRPDTQGDGVALADELRNAEYILLPQEGGTGVTFYAISHDLRDRLIAALRRPAQSWQELRTTPPQPEQMDTSGFADSGDMT